MKKQYYYPEYKKTLRDSNKEFALKHLGNKCAQDSNECEGDLEFDHIDPQVKAKKISLLFEYSRSRLIEELAKCQLLCHKHHRAKTTREMSVEHGEGLTGKKSCFCALCKPLKQAYGRKRRTCCICKRRALYWKEVNGLFYCLQCVSQGAK